MQQAEQGTKAHERLTVQFLQEAASAVPGPFKNAQGSGTFRPDESNRRASRQDGFCSGELACGLSGRPGVPSVESRLVLSARMRSGAPFLVRINARPGKAATPAELASQVFGTLIDKVRHDVVTALVSGPQPA